MAVLNEEVRREGARYTELAKRRKPCLDLWEGEEHIREQGETYLYKHANPLWELLIRRRLVLAVWSPLVQASRWRQVRFRRKLEEMPAPGPAALADSVRGSALRILP